MQCNAISDKDLMLWFYLFQRKANLILAYAKQLKNREIYKKNRKPLTQFSIQGLLTWLQLQIAVILLISEES